MSPRTKWFLFGFSVMLSTLVSLEILAMPIVATLFAAAGLIVPLSTVLLSVRKKNISSANSRPIPAPSAESPATPVVTPPAEVPPAMTKEERERSLPAYLAFAICDPEKEKEALAPPAAPAPAGEPEPLKVEAAPEVAWIRELIPLGFHEAVETFKRRLLEEAISLAEGNRAEAARRLGLQRTYLYRLARQLGTHDSAGDRSTPN